MVFKIPIIKRDNFFSFPGGIDPKLDEMDKLRDELQKRCQIKFVLWLDGEDVLPDDNLGYVICNIAEITKGPVEPLYYVEYKTRKKYHFASRVLTQTSKFSSSRCDVSNISITYTIYFAEEIDKDIDLKEYDVPFQDSFPFEIAKDMKFKKEPEDLTI